MPFNYTSKRVDKIQAPPLVELGVLAKTTNQCISLGQGAPFYRPDAELFAPLIEEFPAPSIHRYTSDPGIEELREALATKLSVENKIPSQAEQIVVTPGANQAFFNVLLTITDPGDEVILLSPYYFNHLMACDAVNVRPVIVPLETDFSISKIRIEAALSDRTRAIVLVNPGNPTGRVHSVHDLQVLREVLEDYEILLISDETYEYFVYGDQQHVSIGKYPSISDQVITIGSFSKTYGIPGWRLGYYRADNEIIDQSIKIQDTIGICAPAPAQYLALELLRRRNAIIPAFVQLMKDNHLLAKDLMTEVEWLQSTPSSGAYYVFPRQETSLDSTTLSTRLITDYRVYIVPGGGFGESWNDHMRISFANVQAEELKEAFSRLRSFRV